MACHWGSYAWREPDKETRTGENQLHHLVYRRRKHSQAGFIDSGKEFAVTVKLAQVIHPPSPPRSVPKENRFPTDGSDFLGCKQGHWHVFLHESRLNYSTMLWSRDTG